MREDILSNARTKLGKLSEQNQIMATNIRSSVNVVKPKSTSSWGSHFVKGFTTDKKTKQQTSNANKKQSVIEISSQKSNTVSYHSRVKRSLVGEFPCTANAAQVHPHVFDCHRTTSNASHDLFLELDHLRELLRESKERESTLQSELLLYKGNPRALELEKELESRKIEVENLTLRVNSLKAENTTLSQQLSSLSSMSHNSEGSFRLEDREHPTDDSSTQIKKPSYKNLEIEVVELRRLNKELQFQKRNLAFRLSSAESQLTALAKVTESDILAKVQAEALSLRHTNESLSKQVEGLQISRLNEVEELAYLRWVNSCLRHELSNSDKASKTPDLEDEINSQTDERVITTVAEHQTMPCYSNKPLLPEFCNSNQVGFVKRLVKWSENNEEYPSADCETLLDKDWIEAKEGRSPTRRHSISGTKRIAEDITINKRRQSDSFVSSKELHDEASITGVCHAARDKHLLLAQKYDLCGVQSPRFSTSKLETFKVPSLDVEKRALRIPNPPPRPSTSVRNVVKANGSIPLPPPPPPPPPAFRKSSTRKTGLVQRAPQVAELYHSLMRRDSKRDSSGGGICDVPNVANVRSSMIGEIENRSSHLLAIKADVETQGEFVKSLIKEVNDAAYHDIEDVVAFVKWLDDELCFLVDERAVLKHFDWPEKKADTLREAAFEYRDMKKLESEVSNFEDDPRLPCDIALKKMVALSEKMERNIYNLLRTRDVMVRHCKEFQIPTDWMLDSGIISKIKFGSVKLAKMYMKRVATELQVMGVSNKDPALEYMLLQGVRFAFRIHQFAGGFDAETMDVFEELQNLAYVRNKA
ncbi:protein CHUP1, chloroplastic-like [Canna indica]|uniref:Protein CHUP1, chloroplastic-like n=1 Tax=Canna indica TaxID=4628 RepID=A0AAQ3L157_9LILI|nr:protein CHUP1, chloroplastic-like [Canna indica]